MEYLSLKLILWFLIISIIILTILIVHFSIIKKDCEKTQSPFCPQILCSDGSQATRNNGAEKSS